MSTLVALLCSAGWLLGAPPGTVHRSGPRRGSQARERHDRAPLTRLRWPLTVGAALGTWSLVGGAAGAVAGAVAGIASWRVLGNVASPTEVRRRRELERDLPIAVHLFGAALGAGASASGALADVAVALPGPIGEEFALLGRRLTLGVDPVAMWRAVDGPLRPMGQALARAQESGSSVLGAVDRLAEELRAASRARRDALARSVEVRAAAPLGLCFLPSFLLVGVIPMVVGLFTSLRLFA